MSNITLTDKQKEDAQEVMDHLMQYFWHKILIKMENGMSFEVASLELQEEILND